MGIVTLGVIQFAAGVYLYFSGYTTIVDFNVNGGTFLPEFKINYNSFSLYVYYSIIASGMVLGLSLIAA